MGVGIEQLERAGLGCQAKNQLCFQRSSRERSCWWYFQLQCHPRRRSRPPWGSTSVVVSIKSKAPRWVGWKSGGSFHGTSFGQIDIRRICKPQMTPILGKKSSLSIIKIVRIELANYRGSFNTLIFKENKPSIGFCHEGRLGRRVVLTSQPEASNFVAQLSSLGRCARESSPSD